jgi:hypothetical protein
VATDVPNLSRGPRLAERGVHIIFVPDGVGGVEPGSEALPTEDQLTEAARYIGHPDLTDVIVFAGRPWHYAEGKLRKHPEVHDDFPHTVLELSVERGERAVWWSEFEFKITKIAEHPHDGTDTPAAVPHDPAPPPFDSPATQAEDDVDKSQAKIHVARSTVPDPGAKGFEYKITFIKNGQSKEIDPNMRCI